MSYPGKTHTKENATSPRLNVRWFDILILRKSCESVYIRIQVRVAVYTAVDCSSSSATKWLAYVQRGLLK